jgi:putative ABC transport system substrate-binding protein
MYSMILNPPGVCRKAETACGVSLDLPARQQLEMIARGLPSVKRLGLLFDPQCNGGFSVTAGSEAGSFQLSIVPLPVSSKKDIPAVLKEHWSDIDALWLIPDQTIISESIVQYIIKEALLAGVPVVGYNRFFYESGAALAFVFDYKDLGRQTGRLAAGVIGGGPCEKESPVFRVWRNRRVINKLGLGVSETATPPIEEGP